MKYITALIMGCIFVIALTVFITPYANDMYMTFYKLSSGPDTETILLDKLIFIHIPIYFILGFIAGIFLHKKCLTNKDRSREAAT